jgi:ribosomal protein S7
MTSPLELRCALEPIDVITVAQSAIAGRLVVSVRDVGVSRYVQIDVATARQLRDYLDRWLRTQEVQHVSNDTADRDGAESIAAAVARHVVDEGE